MANDTVIDEWYEKAKNVHNVEQLEKFIESIRESGPNGYDGSVHAATAIAIAASWCADDIYGFSAYQASFIGLLYLLHWTYDYKGCVGISVTDYTDMLYPQCQYKFEKKIDKDMFKALQEAAKKKLDDGDYGTQEVREHWQSIVDGNVPFGYELK